MKTLERGQPIHKWRVEEIKDDGTPYHHGNFGGHEIEFIADDKVRCFGYYCLSEEDVDNGISHEFEVVFPRDRLRIEKIGNYHD